MICLMMWATYLLYDAAHHLIEDRPLDARVPYSLFRKPLLQRVGPPLTTYAFPLKASNLFAHNCLSFSNDSSFALMPLLFLPFVFLSSFDVLLCALLFSLLFSLFLALCLPLFLAFLFCPVYSGGTLCISFYYGVCIVYCFLPFGY